MLTAPEAAQRLGISVATLYAYVSRGLIRSFHDPQNPRGRLYSDEDIERRKPEKAAERALQVGGEEPARPPVAAPQRRDRVLT